MRMSETTERVPARNTKGQVWGEQQYIARSFIPSDSSRLYKYSHQQPTRLMLDLVYQQLKTSRFGQNQFSVKSVALEVDGF